MFEFLKWDSQFFGKRIGKFVVSNKVDLDQLLTSFNDSDFDLLYLVDPNKSSTLEENLQSKGISVIDKKTYFFKEINPAIKQQEGVVEAETIDQELISIALQSGIHSRFKLDPKLNSQYRDLYTEWISKSVEHKFDDQVYIIRAKSNIQALISARYEHATAKIGLFAVDQKHRGKGLGTKLLKQSEYWGACKKANTIEVVTQKDNKAACSLYSNYGFKIKETHNIYHLWK